MNNFVSDEEKIEAWKAKPVHGVHTTILQMHGVDFEATTKWLSTGVLFYETESFLVEIEDCAVPNRNHRRNVLQDTSVTNTM